MLFFPVKVDLDPAMRPVGFTDKRLKQMELLVIDAKRLSNAVKVGLHARDEVVLVTCSSIRWIERTAVSDTVERHSSAPLRLIERLSMSMASSRLH